jgi:hypothetical protein
MARRPSRKAVSRLLGNPSQGPGSSLLGGIFGDLLNRMTHSWNHETHSGNAYQFAHIAATAPAVGFPSTSPHEE